MASRMLELAMAARLVVEPPALGLDQLDDIADFHGRMALQSRAAYCPQREQYQHDEQHRRPGRAIALAEAEDDEHDHNKQRHHPHALQTFSRSLASVR
mgnify:CR=1 FL=1